MIEFKDVAFQYEQGSSKGKIENINSVFKIKVYDTNEKPTNGEFIALVADKMLIEGY